MQDLIKQLYDMQMRFIATGDSDAAEVLRQARSTIYNQKDKLFMLEGRLHTLGQNSMDKIAAQQEQILLLKEMLGAK